MTAKTVTWVSEVGDPYVANGKSTWYVNVAFDDESTGSVGKQDRDKAEELRGMLIDLENAGPVEFILEDKGKPNKKGKPSYRIKGFPGYEPAPFGGGGGGESPGKQDSIMRQSALKSAVALLGSSWVPPEGYGDVTWDVLAEEMYAWLRKTSPASHPKQETAGVSSEGAPATSSPGPEAASPARSPRGSTSEAASLASERAGQGQPGEVVPGKSPNLEAGAPAQDVEGRGEDAGTTPVGTAPGAPGPHAHHMVQGRDGWLVCNAVPNCTEVMMA